MAAFVDDVRASFDAADFCKLVSAAVGVGKTTSALALRDSSAVSLATAALQSFLRHATSQAPPDVVAAYVQYSPAANELFTALRAVSVNTPLASLALDCLIAISHYAHHQHNPLHAVDAARGVLKEVVKTRAVLIRDIFANDHAACAKKALRLLTLVASTHHVLAKEVLNRFNLADNSMMTNLCSTRNNFCRVPFLALIQRLLASADFDIASSFCFNNRPVLVTCLNVITERTVKEAYPSKPSVTLPREKGNNKLKKTHKAPQVLPSHLQREELNAAINFLIALETHILALPQHSTKRAAFAFPMLDLLAQIAAADIPPPEIAPTQVLPQHQNLRQAALDLFRTVAMDSRISSMRDVISALTSRVIAHRIATVKFILHIVECQPRVAKGLLEKGKYLRDVPHLSSSWFGTAAVISTCVLRLPCAITKFAETTFFAKCLSHEDPLIRNTGITIMNAFCKVVQADKEAAARPEAFLPSVDRVQFFLKRHQDIDGGAQRLLSAYQQLLCDETGGTKADPVKLSVEMAGEDLEMSDDAIRAAFSVSPNDALLSILKKGYFARLILRATASKSMTASRRLWHLSHEILMHTGLFPAGNEHEMDIYLSLFATQDAYSSESATALEKIIFMAWSMPFRLYDDLRKDYYDTCHGPAPTSTSLLSVASVYRLRKLKASKSGNTPQEAQFQTFLQSVLTTTAACQQLMGSFVDGGFLDDALCELGLGFEHDGLTNTRALLRRCQSVHCLFRVPSNYVNSPYLKGIQAMALLHLENGRNSKTCLKLSAAADIGFVWNAWRNLRETAKNDYPHDPFTVLPVDFPIKAKAGVHLGRLLCSLQEGCTESDISQYIVLLKEMLTIDDFMLSLGLGLSVGQGEGIRSLMRSATETLIFALGKSKAISQSESFLQESIIANVKGDEKWGGGDIKGFFTLALATLKKWNEFTERQDRVSFALALMAHLVDHQDIGTAVLAQTQLRLTTHIVFPPLSDLSCACAIHASHLLKHSSALTEVTLANLAAVTATELARYLHVVLPVIDVLMRPNTYFVLKEDSIYNHEKIVEAFLGAVPVCNHPFARKGDGNSSQIKRTTFRIGETLLRSASTWKQLFRVAKEAREKENWIVLGNVWMLSESVFTAKGHREMRESIPNAEIVGYLAILTEWIAHAELDVDDACSSAALYCFRDALQFVRTRKITVYSVWKEVEYLEKSLTIACSKLMKCFHQLSACCSDGEAQKEDAIVPDKGRVQGALDGLFLVPLVCVSNMLGLDLVLDKAAKRSLLSLAAHNGNCMTSSLSKRSKERELANSNDRECARALSTLIHSALLRMPRFSMEAEVAVPLSTAEGALSYVYRASTDSADIAIRKCMEVISGIIVRNRARSKFDLVDRRTGFLGPSPSTVVSLFQRNRLQRSCTSLLGLCTGQTAAKLPCIGALPMGKQWQEDEYDSVFVLRTFFCACAEARKAPQTAVLDIGRIARDGVLAVALTGIATNDDEIRALSFACLHQFALVVGPVAGVEVGSAAALFKDRRQLALLLELLKNSFSEPMPVVLPLFAVWFQKALRVALSPTHEANKAVTFFFLRSPSLDVLDCLGLSQLLNSGSAGRQLRAVRLLALDIVKSGAISAKDIVVLKRRKVLDTLLELGGGTSTDEQDVSDQALETLSTLVSRSGLSLGQELVFSHGVIPWVLQDAGQDTEPDRVLRIRLDLLSHICNSFINHDKRERMTEVFADALATLARRVLDRRDHRHSKYIIAGILRCTEAIAKLNPYKREYLNLDFSRLCLKLQNSETIQSFGFSTNAIVFAIARQRNLRISPETYPIMLRTTTSMVDFEGTSSTQEVFEMDCSSEISLTHAFIAQGLLQINCGKLRNNLSSSELCVCLANALRICPTVWLAVACLRTLEASGILFSDLQELTDLLPGQVPDVIFPKEEPRLHQAVDRVRFRMIDNLLLCWPKKEGNTHGTHLEANGVKL